jgi:hypothetical protein
VDEGRNRFEGRRDNVDRDSREPHKWEHDLSTYKGVTSAVDFAHRCYFQKCTLNPSVLFLALK